MKSGKPGLLWIFCAGSLLDSLDSATWLDTGKELCRDGWKVTLIAGGASGTLDHHGVQIVNFQFPEIYLLRQLIFHVQVAIYILKHLDSCDVVMFHTMSAPWLMPIWIFRKVMNRRLPLFVMDTRTMEMTPRVNQSFKERVRRKYYEITEKWVNNWVDGRTAITRRMADVVGISQEKLWGIWPSGVDDSLFTQCEKKRVWPQTGGVIHLVYIGVLTIERNLLTFCQAVEKANSEGMRFTMTLIGSGSAQAELEAFAAQSEGRIRVLPPVEHAEIPNLLAQAHVGVLPFPDEVKFQVSSPIKLFEYMASGLVILSTRIVCHTDVIGDGDFGFWAEKSDVPSFLSALRDVWGKSDHLPLKGTHSIHASRAWTWRESARKLGAALESGLAKAGR